MSGIDPSSKQEIIKYCSNPDHRNYTFLLMRPGVYGWMVELEYTKFKPDTDANEGFHLFTCAFPESKPIPELTMCVVSIDKSGQEFAEKILWKHGLKRSEPELIFKCIGPEGEEDFFVHGPNTFVLENHSKGAPNVAYSNDPEKLKRAHEHECTIAERFFREHAEWLQTPEGFRTANAFWAKHPKGRVY